ncbi:MAG: hypothetical protein KME05_17305 [Gloeocapsa sp. UFS-A4-WI-NPMV-4B04]|nr:hypothetical protein [Gloeocapsa sp. UFS-A4-WI-NPMV-4B04]
MFSTKLSAGIVPNQYFLLQFKPTLEDSKSHLSKLDKWLVLRSRAIIF